MTKPVNYILDTEIKGFFDNVDHKWLIKFLENDIEDKNFIRYIVRFLKSGIMEKEIITNICKNCDNFHKCKKQEKCCRNGNRWKDPLRS